MRQTHGDQEEEFKTGVAVVEDRCAKGSSSDLPLLPKVPQPLEIAPPAREQPFNMNEPMENISNS